MTTKQAPPVSVRLDEQAKADLKDIMRRLRVNRNQAVKRALRMMADAIYHDQVYKQEAK
jgi:hypothetical protein